MIHFEYINIDIHVGINIDRDDIQVKILSEFQGRYNQCFYFTKGKRDNRQKCLTQKRKITAKDNLALHFYFFFFTPYFLVSSGLSSSKQGFLSAQTGVGAPKFLTKFRSGKPFIGPTWDHQSSDLGFRDKSPAACCFLCTSFPLLGTLWEG